MSIPLQQSAVSGRNHLLDRLPVHERNAVLRGSHTGEYEPGQELTRARSGAEFVFFPATAVVSVLGCSTDGECVPLALVGSEGLVGIEAVLEGSRGQYSAIVRTAGVIHRVGVEELQRQFKRAGELQKQILRFSGTYLAQISLNTVCNRLHGEESRLSRWLLMVMDRSPGNDIEVPLGALADVASCTVNAAGRLLRGLVHGNIIRYRDNVITVLDRVGLEMSACSCYEAARLTVGAAREKR